MLCLPAPLFTSGSCTAITPGSFGGSTSDSPGLAICSLDHGLCRSRVLQPRFLTKLEHLNRRHLNISRSRSLVPLAGDRGLCGRRQGRGAQLLLPPLLRAACSHLPPAPQGSCVGQLKAARARVSWEKQRQEIQEQVVACASNHLSE